MLRFSGLAHFPSVIDENVGEPAPPLLGEQALNILFDLVRILLIGHAEAQAQPFDVGVHNYTGNVKDSAKHAVRSLSSYAGKFQKFVHGGRHFPSVEIDEALAATFNGFGLVPVKACGPDILFKFSDGHLKEIFRFLILPEQGLGDLIHLLVRALSRQNGRYKELKSIPVSKRCLFIGVERVKDVENEIRPFLFLF